MDVITLLVTVQKKDELRGFGFSFVLFSEFRGFSLFFVDFADLDEFRGTNVADFPHGPIFSPRKKKVHIEVAEKKKYKSQTD